MDPQCQMKSPAIYFQLSAPCILYTLRSIVVTEHRGRPWGLLHSGDRFFVLLSLRDFGKRNKSQRTNILRRRIILLHRALACAVKGPHIKGNTYTHKTSGWGGGARGGAEQKTIVLKTTCFITIILLLFFFLLLVFLLPLLFPSKIYYPVHQMVVHSEP